MHVAEAAKLVGPLHFSFEVSEAIIRYIHHI